MPFKMYSQRLVLFKLSNDQFKTIQNFSSVSLMLKYTVNFVLKVQDQFFKKNHFL